MSSEPLDLLVPRAEKGKRLDQFLVGALAGASPAPSRATVQRWIQEGLVLIRGRTAPSANLRVTEGDRVLVTPGAEPKSAAVPDADVVFEVLHEDASLLVVWKPAGLVVHPARGHESGTLVNGLLARGYFRGDIADERDREGHLRPGIVHRLDAGTAGVMVVARTAPAREALKAQFQAHSIDRVYEALTVGIAEAKTHSTLHGRHPTDRKRFTTHVREGKRAVTHVEVLTHFGDLAAHVRCRLETGRTHQIRVHLAESGTPIVGDPLYGKRAGHRSSEVARVGEALGHQALVARVLGFDHPKTGKRVRFEAPLPEDFLQALAALRSLSSP